MTTQKHDPDLAPEGHDIELDPDLVVDDQDQEVDSDDEWESGYADDEFDETDPEESATDGDWDLEARYALKRVGGLRTELEDITEVEYRQLRLERVVLVGVWTEGTT